MSEKNLSDEEHEKLIHLLEEMRGDLDSKLWNHDYGVMSPGTLNTIMGMPVITSDSLPDESVLLVPRPPPIEIELRPPVFEPRPGQGYIVKSGYRFREPAALKDSVALMGVWESFLATTEMAALVLKSPFIWPGWLSRLILILVLLILTLIIGSVMR